MRKQKTTFHSAGGRRGVNEAAGGTAQYLYTAPARARLGPRLSVPRSSASLKRGKKGWCAEGGPQTEPLWEAWGGNGANAPLRRIFSYHKHS